MRGEARVGAGEGSPPEAVESKEIIDITNDAGGSVVRNGNNNEYRGPANGNKHFYDSNYNNHCNHYNNYNYNHYNNGYINHNNNNSGGGRRHDTTISGKFGTFYDNIHESGESRMHCMPNGFRVRIRGMTFDANMNNILTFFQDHCNDIVSHNGIWIPCNLR